MSSVPVYTQSPINGASKPSGVTPQTAGPESQPSASGPISISVTTATTTNATSPSSYPFAKAGAAAPAPTAAAQRYAPQPTPTTQAEPDGPPAPQPGAFPTTLRKSTLPPPPKAGETYYPPQQTAVPTQPTQSYPLQMGIPPLGDIGSHPLTSSTRTTNAPSSSYPIAVPSAERGGSRQSMEHPPGYQQNAYAADLTPDQRRAQEAFAGTRDNQNSSHNGGDVEQEGVWNTAKNWAQQAGEKLQAAEAEVWRKINKQ